MDTNSGEGKEGGGKERRRRTFKDKVPSSQPKKELKNGTVKPREKRKGKRKKGKIQ